MLIFGMIEFGLLLYNRQVLTNASREGARFGILLQDPDDYTTGDDIAEVVEDYCWSPKKRLVSFKEGASPPVTSVTIGGASCMGSPCCQGATTWNQDLEVTVTYQYDFLVMTNFGFGPIQLPARTLMRCE
jgi:hypothetical protein